MNFRRKESPFGKEVYLADVVMGELTQTKPEYAWVEHGLLAVDSYIAWVEMYEIRQEDLTIANRIEEYSPATQQPDIIEHNLPSFVEFLGRSPLRFLMGNGYRRGLY